jgi:hypothetical protein
MGNLDDPTAILKRPMRGWRLEKKMRKPKKEGQEKKRVVFLYIFSAPLYILKQKHIVSYLILPYSNLGERKKNYLIISIREREAFLLMYKILNNFHVCITDP